MTYMWWLQNYFNITNHNFYSVDVTALDVVMHYDQTIMASETNSTTLTLPMQSTLLHYMTMNATFRNEPFYMM